MYTWLMMIWAMDKWMDNDQFNLMTIIQIIIIIIIIRTWHDNDDDNVYVFSISFCCWWWWWFEGFRFVCLIQTNKQKNDRYSWMNDWQDWFEGYSYTENYGFYPICIYICRIKLKLIKNNLHRWIGIDGKKMNPANK